MATSFPKRNDPQYSASHRLGYQNPETDTSGSYLQQALEEEGISWYRQLVIDDIYQMRAMVSD